MAGNIESLGGESHSVFCTDKQIEQAEHGGFLQFGVPEFEIIVAGTRFRI